VAELLDNRVSLDRISMMKNGYGIDTARILASGCVVESLSAQLRKDLRAAVDGGT
jgi:hypothetical protein